MDAPLKIERHGEWRGISFVRSTTAILYRCMGEKGCSPCAEARLILAGYPDTFDAWKRWAQHGRPPVPSAAISAIGWWL
jgi:hypothetical protein